ncbi:MAG TPA: hypothetical protein VNA20_11435 [Frankiaceae bacterium]|nr:hypothetical protein [Frankiaceae bacterium]
MRRLSLLFAAALSVSGFASSAGADDYTVCYGQICVCVYEPGVVCYTPPQGDRCVAVDLDRDGDAERILCPRFDQG